MVLPCEFRRRNRRDGGGCGGDGDDNDDERDSKPWPHDLVDYLSRSSRKGTDSKSKRDQLI